MIIQNADKCAELILGKQKVVNDIIYRLSPFVYIIKYDDVFLLFNNLTKAFFFFKENEFEELLLSYVVNDDGTVSIDNFKFHQSIELKNLIEGYFFIPTDLDMIRLSDNLRRTAMLLESKKKSDIISFVIFPTTACNARCFYCFEAGIKAFSMSKETAEDVADYIIDKSGDKVVYLRWFGGEPLCNINAIDAICNKLNRNNKKFYGDFTTNGYLFDENIVSKAANEWNTTHVQITIDGLKDTYQKVKNYVNGDPNAYDKVINNIKLLLEAGVQVKIRLNMDLYNADELKILITELNNIFYKYDNWRIYVRPLYENTVSWRYTRTSDERTLVTAKYMELEELIKKYNRNSLHPLEKHITLYRCMADEPMTAMINPKGELGYCEHYPLEDIYGRVTDFKCKKALWSDELPVLDECRECVKYPSCIRLTKCYEGKNECMPYFRSRAINMLYVSVVDKYNEFRKKDK